METQDIALGRAGGVGRRKLCHKGGFGGGLGTNFGQIGLPSILNHLGNSLSFAAKIVVGGGGFTLGGVEG